MSLAMAELETCAWPMSRAGDALEALARASGLPVRLASTPPVPGDFATQSPDGHTRWLDAAAALLGIDIEAAEAAYGDIDHLIRGAAPAVLKVRRGESWSLLLLARGHRRSVSFLAPDLTVRRARIAHVRAALCEPAEMPLAIEIDALLEDIGVAPARRARARAALFRERLASTTVANCWLLRAPAGSSVREQMTLARLWPRLAALVTAHASAYVLWILSWWIVGRAALEGRLDRGWLLAWALLLATVIPFELLVTWLQGRISIDIGGLLKRRLLYGALRLEPEEIRHQGAGQLLGRVIEAQAIEALALSGGFLALMASLELTLAAIVLAIVSSRLAVVLAGCAAASAVFAWRFFVRRRAWTANRLSMTHDLVERMVGHRTRLAQEEREAWHDTEDQTLARYLDASRAMDRAAVWLIAVAPRGWLVIGIAALSPLFIAGSAASPALAVALGGILLAYRAFRKLAAGVSQLAGAAIAWSEAATVFQAAARPQTIGSPAFALSSRSTPEGRAFLDGHELSFRYQGRGEPVLRGCSVHIRHGDRLLLQGPSGGGKSTLASLLTGLRLPDSGLLLLDGVDRRTLGDAGWRRRVVAVPQFHENHVFMGTVTFNLLMGGEWPPRQEHVERAEGLCRELGLGDLLARMPAGVLQQVGETGWQLSHGERSRLFIARALLQRADLVVLDESFAQLDPENLQRTLQCVLRHQATVLVIAHP